VASPDHGRHGRGGINHPIGCGTYINNFVFWIGIGHAGTLISAILYLFRVRWRTAIYRSAEAMTVFAVMTAGLFPLIHLGRLGLLVHPPYPNQRYVHRIQVPAGGRGRVTTYLTISIVFYAGMPRSRRRDATTCRRQRFYRFSPWADREYEHGDTTCAPHLPRCAGDAAGAVWCTAWCPGTSLSLLPGWHSTIFASYFVAGAIHLPHDGHPAPSSHCAPG
jgi:molybdopterin-containing oxidoreductase family membrane subunit